MTLPVQGLQNPFLVDANTDVTVPTVSVSRVLGQQLMSQLGTNASLTVNGSQDYAYYNGTSMATPHVTGVAALVWSNNPNCSAEDVRSALKNTAIDLDVAGRDDKTGFGLVQEKSASVTDISVARRAWIYYTIDLPAGMATLDFAMSGGSGDADMYIRRGSQPTSATYDCRPYKSGNTENWSFTNRT